MLKTHHLTHTEWLRTPQNDLRGYIDPHNLKELWFHTGTICNLSCPFCLEGSQPGDDRLNRISFEDAKPFIDEGLQLGVEQFSFTGGEPFVNKDIVKILDYALEHCPCLVLTNATQPLKSRLDEVQSLVKKKNALSFRISFDYPDPQEHDAGRGEGSFHLALQTMSELYKMGFSISIARQMEEREKTEEVDSQYQEWFQKAGVPLDTKIVRFPDFLTPGSMPQVPHITEKCMTTYHTEETRSHFMCSFSKMVMKRDGKMRVSACTLVDDDLDYDLGENLKEAMERRVMMKHHRCYSCFARGCSCSEI